MPITLTVVRGPHAGKVFTFDGHDTFMVGRAPDAHLSLPDDPYFSRHHLLIEANSPLCRVSDLGSRNGTTLNGAKVTAAELKDGDEIAGGRTALRVSITATAQDATLDLPPGEQPDASTHTMPESGLLLVPGYRNPVEIGRGAMGVVYRATRDADGTTVAVKTIRPAITPRPGEVARFLREARVLEALVHPHIVRFLEAGEAGGVLYFAMEYVDGTDAARLVRENGPRPLAEAVDIVGQLCEGLAFAHGKGFVHRDVKPANLPLGRRPGGGWDAKLADFGLAKAYQGTRMSGLTVSGATAGTPAFMPPEQISDFKSTRPPADQYAAAATAYYLLTGAFPCGTGPTRTVLKRVLAGEMDRLEAQNPGVPKAVAAVIHRAMATRPEDRYPDVAAFAAALRNAAGQ